MLSTSLQPAFRSPSTTGVLQVMCNLPGICTCSSNTRINSRQADWHFKGVLVLVAKMQMCFDLKLHAIMHLSYSYYPPCMHLTQTGVSCNPQSGLRSDQNFPSIADTSAELCRRHIVSILFHGRIFQTDHLTEGALHLPHKVSTLGHAKAYQFPNRSCPQAQTGKVKMVVIPNT